ncbi:hypothetical protein DXV75_09065 [Alteromonas aestuariivivens]|uniref:Uncharacterized protein n=1 Tax=Alteromonas aestuariivivens TaxID=1938339 RepID=A0A3D8M753_9ALTE|nr:FGGY family carbohydrate kinase [Alteromonas aestuariivivens]RDV25443.1 hypothetical protein DXV75_09065 [Alteromonas aestuariivivens]
MPITQHSNTLIVDIGKTHVKVHLLDAGFTSISSMQMKNKVVNSGEYPCVDADGIWQWLTSSIRTLCRGYSVGAMTFTTHGATAALIDRNSSEPDGLVLPILDYEFDCAALVRPEYDQLRPEFESTLSPSLPLGLNAGRQLYWLQQKYPQKFVSATDILMYPQYWAWRFTGTLCTEITSLGCHTDLWSVAENRYSSLVEHMGIEDKFPPIEPAYFECGTLLPEVAELCGLNSDCLFYSGIHDSNASYLRYKLALEGQPFTVISTGTWTVLMNSQGKLDALNESRDMLANIDAMGAPIACARFMGGREFEEICEQAGSWLGEQFDETDVERIIEQNVFAIPNFGAGSGPFGSAPGRFQGAVDKISGIALATLYCALMIDYQLDMLDAEGNIYIEGAFLKNPILIGIVAQLRSNQRVLLSQDTTGTVTGAAQLTQWMQANCEIVSENAHTTALSGLAQYREAWRALAQSNLGNI